MKKADLTDWRTCSMPTQAKAPPWNARHLSQSSTSLRILDALNLDCRLTNFSRERWIASFLLISSYWLTLWAMLGLGLVAAGKETKI